MSIHGTYATISMADIVFQAKNELDLENMSQWDLFFMTEGEEALRHLNCQSLVVKKQEIIEICEGQTPLPCGLYKFLGLRFYDQRNGACQKVVYADTMFLNSCGCSQWGFPSGETSWFTKEYFAAMQIQGGKMVFVNGHQFDHATIAYLGFNVDADGKFVIYENYVRAIKAYLKYRFLQKRPMHFGNFTPQLRNEARMEWEAQKRWSKGEDNTMNADYYRREIMAAMTALIVSPTIPTWTY